MHYARSKVSWEERGGKRGEDFTRNSFIVVVTQMTGYSVLYVSLILPPFSCTGSDSISERFKVSPDLDQTKPARSKGGSVPLNSGSGCGLSKNELPVSNQTKLVLVNTDIIEFQDFECRLTFEICTG